MDITDMRGERVYRGLRLVNPGFEDTTPQTTPPHPGWIKSENAAFVTNPHHSGVEALEVDTGLWGPPPFGPPQSYAYQQVTIPADASHPILRYFLDVQTSVTGTSAVDTLSVKIIPPQPNSFPPVHVIPTMLATYSNLDNTHGAGAARVISTYRPSVARRSRCRSPRSSTAPIPPLLASTWTTSSCGLHRPSRRTRLRA